MKVNDRNNMYQAKKGSVYKTGDKEPPMNTPGGDVVWKPAKVLSMQPKTKWKI